MHHNGSKPVWNHPKFYKFSISHLAQSTGEIRIKYVFLYGKIRPLYAKIRTLYACTGMYGYVRGKYVQNTYRVRILYVLSKILKNPIVRP